MATLLFFTQNFPFGQLETFIENEFPFLEKNFDKIYLITTNQNELQTRAVSKKTEIIRLSYETKTSYKLKALTHTFSPDIQGEIAFIKQQNIPLQYNTLATLYSAYGKALEIKDWLQDFIRQNKIDTGTLYLYSYWMNNIALGLAMYKQHQPDAKAFCRAHGWDVYFNRHQPPYLPLRNFVFRSLDACFCISQNGQQYLQKLQTGAAKKNILLSRLGTVNKNDAPVHAHQQKIVLVSCSSVIALKRIHLIVEALALLNDIKIEWIHFGSGSLLEEINNLAAARLALKSNISYRFNGHISNAELLRYYATHPVDLFINVSETEGLPVSIMEALSYSIPAVATHVGGTAEVVLDCLNGFLLTASPTAQEISETISRYFHLPVEQKTALRVTAHKIWSEKYNAENNYSAFIEKINAL